MSDLIERLKKLTSNLGKDHRTGMEFVRNGTSQDVVDALRQSIAALSEAEQREKDARLVALGDAAATHETRVTELRTTPTSYKNGKITKSAKRASDFHERSAAVIRALQSEES